jgi:hypothetical protein
VGANDSIVFAAPVAGELRDPNNVSGDMRQLLDSFECQQCADADYRVDSDGSFVLRPRGHRLRCRPVRGPGSPRTPSARRSPRDWTRPDSRHARLPISSATRTRR